MNELNEAIRTVTYASIMAMIEEAKFTSLPSTLIFRRRSLIQYLFDETSLMIGSAPSVGKYFRNSSFSL
jgi:hypothetical protein